MKTTSPCGSMCGSMCSSMCNPRAASRAGWLLALGFAGGLLGGLFVARRSNKPRACPALPIWQRELSQTRGTVDAAFLAGRVQARYEQLMAARPRFDHPALRMHLRQNILPGLALYQTLREDGLDQPAALAEIDRLFEVTAQRGSIAQAVKLAGRMPDPYNLIRQSQVKFLDSMFPAAGWTFTWMEDSDQAIAYNCTDCFYHNILTRLGAPELTASFCRTDDVAFANVPGVAWLRTQTIGRGDPLCNFRFERKN